MSEVAAAKPSSAMLEGRWVFLGVEVDGVKLQEHDYRGATMQIRAGRFVSCMPQGRFAGTLTLDVSRSPATIDLRFTSGPHRGSSSLGIFELEGDVWRLCIGLAGVPRPTAFSTAPGSGRALEMLERVSP